MRYFSWRALLSVFVTALFLCDSGVQSKELPEKISGTALYKSMRDAHNGEMPVYYDYVEDGQLKGGMTTVLLPELTLKSLSSPPPAWNVTTIMDNGPPANRINIVILGDGYTAGELNTYADHVDTTMVGYFAQKPLSTYAGYFNVHRVDVISNESGVDESDADPPVYRDTALDMYYNCGGTARLLCINVSKALDAASLAPKVDQVIAMANSTRYGGAGYPDLATLAGGNGSSVELALHEFGHSFGKLADEYSYGGAETYTGSEPSSINNSIYDASQQLSMQTKWYRWLDLANVDTFEGARYSRYGIYRPTYNSKMRSLGSPFEQVNIEQLIFQMYSYVSPIDHATPQSAEPLPFFQTLYVQPVQPANHSLDIQWSVDGVEIDGAISGTFNPGSIWLSDGIHEVSVTVVDNTTKVRDESKRQSLMTGSRSWQIEVVNADVSRNGIVDYEDFAMFASNWLDTGCQQSNLWCSLSSLDGDSAVDHDDLSILAATWLKQYPINSLAILLPLDESQGLTANDSSPNDRDGQLVNNPAWNSSGGKYDGALAFDGFDDYVSVSDYYGISGSDARTVTAWIKTQGTLETMNIVSWGEHGVASRRFKFFVMADGRLSLSIGGQSIASIGTVNLVDDQWHHVAVTTAGGEMAYLGNARLYIDGVERTDSIANGNPIDTGNTMEVAIGVYDLINGHFKGMIDDVRIYETQLSAEQIAMIAGFSD